MIPKNAIIFIILNQFPSKKDFFSLFCILSTIKPIINTIKDITSKVKPIGNSIYTHLQSNYLQQVKELRSRNAKLMSYKNNYIIFTTIFKFSEYLGLI